MGQWLLVVAVDLVRVRGNVVLGKKTKKVCDVAARLWHEHPGRYVCAPAPWCTKHQLWMGNGPMREYLTSVGGVPHVALVTPTVAGEPFSTHGETSAFAKTLATYGEYRPEIFIVARDWHIPRVKALLNARLKEQRIIPAHIQSVPVPSREIMERFVREPLAWIKNVPHLYTQPGSS